MKNTAVINKDRLTNIVGVTDGSIASLGSIKSSLVPDPTQPEINLTFTVVPDHFPIPVDGIIGKDFIKANNCALDYLTMTFTIRHDNRSVSLPIIDDSLNDIYHIIPPRCEVIRQFQLNTKSTSDQVVDKDEIFPGVFVASTIVDPQNCMLRILNTTSQPIELKRVLKLKTQKLSNFEITPADKPIKNRKSTLLNILAKNMPEHAPKSLLELCKSYSDIFALPDDPHSVNNFYEQSLQLSDKNPVYVKNYRLPHSQKTEISKQINDMLTKNIIEPSCSNYNSPIILVPKKSVNGEKNFRLCVDYRELNRRLIPDKFPLPRIDEVLDNLGRARYFSTLDLYAGFWQVPLNADSKNFTSFSTGEGSFRFNVLPFGLNIAPNSFARMMHIAFSGLDPSTAFLYLDDIIVIGTSQEHHIKNLEKVFKVCRSKNLKLNPAKCNFMKAEVTYLGHRCTDRGILPDNSKFATISDYPVPKDKEAAKRFVLFCNYYRNFIDNFAAIASPLNNLDKKNVKFEWTSECQKSFDTLKETLKNPPILQYPDFEKPFIITVDASKGGIGAVLSQISDDGSDLPVSYASKSFTKGQRNKAVIEQELLAIHFGIKQFRPYVYGTKFTVRSDHKPLQYLFSMKDPTSKLARIRLDLTDYDFFIEHVKGRDNVAADALSRIDFADIVKMHDTNIQILAMTTRSSTKTTVVTNFIKSLNNYDYRNTPSINFTIKQIDADKSEITGVLKTRHSTQTKTFLFPTNSIDARDLAFEAILGQLEQLTTRRDVEKVKINSDDPIFSIVSPEDLQVLANKYLKTLVIVLMLPIQTIEQADERQRLLHHYHYHPLEGGHSGTKRTYSKLKSLYNWNNMARDVASFIKKCTFCHKNKSKVKNKEEMVITNTPSEPFESIIIDTIGPFPSTVNQSKYAITIICDFSKFLIIVPIPNKSAKTVAKVLVEHCILTFGPVKRIRSDLGTEYANSVMDNLTSILQIEHDMSTAYHHETLGTVERSHKTLNEYLRSYISDNPKEWFTYVKYFAFCFNTTPNTSIDMYTPFELVYGRKANSLCSIRNNSLVPDSYDDYVNSLKFNLDIAYKRTKEFIHSNKNAYKQQYDRNARPLTLSVGENVLLVNEVRSKLDPFYTPGFVVKKLSGPNATIVNLTTGNTQTVHKNRIRKY